MGLRTTGSRDNATGLSSKCFAGLYTTAPFLFVESMVARGRGLACGLPTHSLAPGGVARKKVDQRDRAPAHHSRLRKSFSKRGSIAKERHIQKGTADLKRGVCVRASGPIKPGVLCESRSLTVGGIVPTPSVKYLQRVDQREERLERLHRPATAA
jgi:hypothetical protein